LQVQPTTAGSIRNEDVLTEKGERLSVILVALAHWGESDAFAPDEERPQVVDRPDRRPVLALAEDGGNWAG
jgi:DNA-binding HxlR family transcriptional regulator